MKQNENRAIIEQVEFYFSNANIVRDEYLKKIIEANKGWAPIQIINSFGKMKLFNKTETELEDILKESDKIVVEEGRIQRKEPIPTYEEHKGEEKTVLIKNFPLTYTLEDVQKALEPHKERIARITLRRDLLKDFKGSVFVELHDKEHIELLKDSKLTVDAPIESEENQDNTSKRQKILLEVHDSKEYFIQKRAAKKEEKEIKKQKEIKVIVDSFKNKLFKFTVQKEDTPAQKEEIDQIKISDIKQKISEGVSFVDIPNRHVRMSSNKEEIEPIEVNGLVISFSKLTDKEVEEYCNGLSLTPAKKLTKPRRKRY